MASVLFCMPHLADQRLDGTVTERFLVAQLKSDNGRRVLNILRVDSTELVVVNVNRWCRVSIIYWKR
jgi:hypothetical protein